MAIINTPENRTLLTTNRAGEANILEEITPNRNTFAYEKFIEVCFLTPSQDQGTIILVSADLQYTGRNYEIEQVFATTALENGWRSLGQIKSTDPNFVLRYVDALLDIDGHGARILQNHSQEREVIITNEQKTTGTDPKLEGFGQDLVQSARTGKFDHLIGREKEVTALVRIISKLNKNAVCLIGEPGVGKTAVVEKMALQIAKNQVPPSIRNSQVMEVNLGFLAAGASHKNEFEGRFKKLLDQARNNSQIILFFDELHILCSTTNDVSQMIKADLGRGQIRCIGATTNQEWRIIAKDPALARRFQPIPVSEPTPEETIIILQNLGKSIQKHHGVTIAKDLYSHIVNLTIRYITDRRLPDKAIDLLDEAAAYEAMCSAQNTDTNELSVQEHSTKLVENAEDLDTAIQEAIARGDYTQAYELNTHRLKRELK